MYIRNENGLGLKNRPELKEGEISLEPTGLYLFKGKFLSRDYTELLKPVDAQRIIANADNFTIGKIKHDEIIVPKNNVAIEQQSIAVVNKQQKKTDKPKSKNKSKGK